MICAQAPGKMLLIGEYAVLEGGDALVFAVDRLAQVSVSRAAGNEFSVAASSLEVGAQPFVLTPHGEVRFDPNLNKYICAKLSFFKNLFEFFIEHLNTKQPEAIRIELQTDAFYSAEWQRKLGFGSSAALTVALFKALETVWHLKLNSETLFRLALAAHRKAQDNLGSGIDVAASFSGRVVRYVMNSINAQEQNLPQTVPPWPELPMAVIWSGASASTKNWWPASAH